MARPQCSLTSLITLHFTSLMSAVFIRVSERNSSRVVVRENWLEVRSLLSGIMGGSPCPIEVMKQVMTKLHMPQVTVNRVHRACLHKTPSILKQMFYWFTAQHFIRSVDARNIQQTSCFCNESGALSTFSRVLHWFLGLALRPNFLKFIFWFCFTSLCDWLKKLCHIQL